MMVVTAAMDRVRYSIEPAETNSQFSASIFNLLWRNWLFGAHRAQPAAGHAGMTIGIDLVQQPRI
jgi:hypothetical protein